MIYELRTYWAAEGKLEALHDRFRDVTLGVFAKLDMQVVGFWTPENPTDETGDLIYIMAFESKDAMQNAWAMFRDDPDWVNGKEASEVNGKLVTKVVSVVMDPTDYSLLK